MAKAFNTTKNTNRAILVIAGILVLSALGYFATKYFTEKNANQTNVAKIGELSDEILELEDEISEMQLTLKDQNMELAEKTKSIEEKDQKLEELLAQIARAKREKKADLGTIRTLEGRVQEQKRVIDGYRTELEQLRSENLALTGEVEDLRNTEGQLREQNADLNRQNQETSQELDKTRQIASVLRTRGFRFFNVKKEGKEKEDDEFRRGSMKNVKVCFTIMENLI
ncbi:MAG: hypothetical protein AAF206_16850, partial [Bacteroidota bacterium]